jgi:ADP-ribosylglycohydrolase
MGNGGAMRVAPIGAYFADDLDAVVRHACASAEPTHAHMDGQAGAIAAGIATAIAWQMGNGMRAVSGEALLQETIARTPPGATRDGLEKAATLPLSYDPRTASAALGNGSRVISSDTVPLAVWCAARHLRDYEAALWTTVSCLGDRDTTCAIVGGIVACYVGYSGLPSSLVDARESLDSTADYVERYEERSR